MARRFEVAFSLASQQRALIEPIAQELKQRGRSVFYYAWKEHEAELAKPNLDIHLRRIYGKQSKLIVPVLSAEYARKPWTGVVEFTVMREVVLDRRDDELMPLRADDTEVEGFSTLHGYVDLRGRRPEDIADLIEARLSLVAPEEHVVAEASQRTEASPFHPLVRGIETRSYDYAGRVQNFLREYLDAPFGGRDRELDDLSAWLSDPEAPPYLILTGPSGRGKSALLARWMEQVVSNEQHAVIYFPISARFETNTEEAVFSSIMARLSGIAGTGFPATPPAEASQWREMFARSLWRSQIGQRRLLIGLDGLDEALGWRMGPGLFPDPAPPGLRLVVAARILAGDSGPQAWADRLGWTHRGATILPLRPLTLDAIAAILANMPASSSIPEGDQTSKELFRLSEGDPLLVRLYLEALSPDRGGHQARVANFTHVPPGLSGYFKRWREEHSRIVGEERARGAQLLLHLLASALRPVMRDDFAEIVPEETKLARGADLDEELKAIARFVIGDGRTQGYRLSHPRLAAHFSVISD